MAAKSSVDSDTCCSLCASIILPSRPGGTIRSLAGSELELSLQEGDEFGKRSRMGEVTAPLELEVLASELRGDESRFGDRNMRVIGRVIGGNPALMIPDPITQAKRKKEPSPSAAMRRASVG